MAKTIIQIRKELKDKLRWGDIGKIAAATGLNRKTVERWFDGENHIQEIEVAIDTIIEKRNERVKSNLKTIL